MVFSSLIFLYLFLPITVVFYYLVPSARLRNFVLLTASLFFYAWGEPIYVFLLVASAVVNFVIGRLLGHTEKENSRKIILFFAVFVNLLTLVVFKCSGFLVECINYIFSTAIPVPDIRLPIGISFYTFQILSYLVDVYRKKVDAQKKFICFLLYVSLFPQLIAGPIVRYSEVAPQLERRKVSPDYIFYGVFRFCTGLAKKVLLANYAGKAASLLLDGNLSSSTSAGIWLGMLLFAFEIYFDFSGYSDMAIGLGRIFGFKFNYNENFDLPYTAVSVTDFWRRWHISLGSFFRDYVYIPLGGNKKHQILNLLIVWSLTGLWHGASVNFLIWGLYFFVLLVLEKKMKKFVYAVPSVIRIFTTFFFVLIGWTMFYFTDLNRLFEALKIMFGTGSVYSDAVGIALQNNMLLLITCVFCCTPLPRFMGLLFGSLCSADKPGQTITKQRIYAVGVTVYDLAILVLCTISLIGSAYNPFLYFRF